MSFCKDCVKGVQHEGTPKGTMEIIGGVECYVATPQVEYPKDKVVLFLTDIFGHGLVNSQLLADDFAANGFKTIVPDYLHGDPVPLAAMSASTFDITSWFKNHGTSDTRPLLDNVIATLKEQGVTTFGASGYCFGARYCMDLAFENVTKKLKAQPTNPILINSCEIDQMFPVEKQKLTDDVLGNGQYKPGYTRAYFAGCTHGFANRGDPSIPAVKAGKEGAFKNAVEFFIQHM